MKPRKEPPSWLKTIGDAILYGGTVGMAGENPFAQPVYDKARSSGVLPSNANALIKFATGNKEGLTEKDFSDKDLAAIMDLVQRAESEGKSYVDYLDYPPGEMPLGNSRSDKMSPHGRVSTTLGQFAFKKNDDGSYSIEDSYDFNNPERYKEYAAYGTGFSVKDLEDQSHIERFMRAYNEMRKSGYSPMDSGYSALREGVVPFIERDPMPVKFKVLKENGGQ